MAGARSDRQKLLIYATVPEAAEHRAIMDVFVTAAEGYRSRLSDYMNQREAEFLPMTDCTITTVETDQEREVPFLLVARRHVRLIAPVDAAGDRVG